MVSGSRERATALPRPLVSRRYWRCLSKCQKPFISFLVIWHDMSSYWWQFSKSTIFSIPTTKFPAIFDSLKMDTVNSRSLAARLPSQKSEDLAQSGMILKSKIRHLCRSLLASQENCAPRSFTETEKLEKVFWNGILHGERNDPAENLLDVEMLLVDAVLVSGEDYACRLKHSLDDLLEYEYGAHTALFLSLLQNEKAGSKSATQSGKSFDSASNCKKAFWDVQKEQLDYDRDDSIPDIFQPRTEIFEAFRTGNSLQIDYPKRPNRILIPSVNPAKPEVPKKPRVQHYVGDCLFVSSVNDFTIPAYQKTVNGTILSVTVQQFIKEICKVFKGLPSSLFQRNEEDNSFRAIDAFCVEGLSPAVAESVCAHAAAGGGMVWQLRVFLDSPSRYPAEDTGNTFRQFCSAVKSYLSTWCSHVDCNLSRVSGDLLKVCDIMRRFSDPLVALLEICSDVIGLYSVGLPNSSYALLQYLYDRAEDCLHLESLSTLILFLLEESAKPFFFFASRLALCGHFDDPFDEFGVILAEKIDKMPVDQLVFSPEIIPTFLWEALVDCVESGRCLQLIRSVDRLHPILPLEPCNPAGRPLLRFSVTQDLETYRNAVEVYAGDIRARIFNKNRELSAFPSAPGNDARADVLIPRISATTNEPSFFQQNLERNLGSLKALLHREILPVTSIQTELAEFALLDLFTNQQNLLIHLRIIRNYFFLSDGSFALPFVTGIFQRAAKHSLRSCLSAIAFLDIFESSLAEPNYPAEWMDRVTASLSLTLSCASTTDKGQSSYDIADYLGLQYKISWPMGMLLTGDIMEKASAVFSRLLRTKGCVWAMEDAFALLADAQYADNISHRHQLDLFRHNIGQVVTALDDYFMEDVMENAWQSLQFRLEHARRFEHLREAVVEYVETVYHRCFFQSSKKSAKCMPLLAHYAMRFAHHLHNGHSFAELENTYNIFMKCCRVFLNALSRSKDSSSSLANQLDFNGFFPDESVQDALRHGSSRNAYATL